MSYILPILTPYRYPILAALSLLLISEMALAGIDLIPIEYEWTLGWLMFLTILAWTGIAVVIGVGAPIGGDAPQDVPKQVPNIYVPDFSVDEPTDRNEPKRRGHIIWILSPALFAMLVLLSILGANIFQAQFILDLIRQPYIRVLIMVWIGMVVIVGATANVDSSKKTYLIMNVLPFLMLTSIMLFAPAAYPSSGLLILVVLLLNSLVIGAILRRTLPDKSWIALAMISLGISVAEFVLVMVVVVSLIASVGGFDTCNDCPGVVVVLFFVVLIVIPVLLSLIFSVPLTILIGTIRRPIRNITVAGIGLVAMLLVSGWYWYVTMDTGYDSIPVEEGTSAERNWNRYGPSCPLGTAGWRAIKGDDGKLTARGYTLWRLPTGDCR